MSRQHIFTALLATSSLFLFLPSPAQAVTYDKLTINGYFNLEYANNLSGDEKTPSGDDVGDNNGSFDIDRLDLVLNFQASDRVRVATDVSWEHGAVTDDERGSVGLEYAFAEYVQNDWLKFRAGKMFTYFGIYNEIHTAKSNVLSAKEPRSTNKITSVGSDLRFFAFHQVGLAILGGGDLAGSEGGLDLDYILQVGNGETETDGANPFEEDDNTHKSFNGRVRLGIGESVIWGLSFYQDEMDDGDGAGTNTDIDSYGTHLQWILPTETGIELEYIQGSVTMDPVKMDRDGLSIMVFHPFGPVTPYLRYELHDPDKDTAHDKASIALIGVNYAVSRGVHLKSELYQTSSGITNSDFEGADFLQFKASLAIGF